MRIIRKDGIVLNIGAPDDQIYSMDDPESEEQWHWNVTEGMRLAEARGDLQAVSLRELGVTVEMLRRQYYGLNEAYAMTTNIAKPLLFVPYRGKVQLVDGWHRILRAALTGIDILPAYILTPEETEQILVCYLPPGKGFPLK
jgi:hypothetical protein